MLLLVTENGIATDDDSRPIACTSRALEHLYAVVAEGVDVRGSATVAPDNFEQGRWAPTFELIAVDRRTIVRTPKPSVAWLGNVARSRGVSGSAD
ncbi:hypothetical protein C5F59_006935 [Streptomyces sp. QL37]|uniref:hypothetical protein n=1 Tax=Streptomyces sp. QL37 TaxID=2093747 RepID=UPI0021CB80BC|nr:hypothetical protein [Streptomyces sp. QL37]